MIILHFYIFYCNKTSCRPIRSVIIFVINKSDAGYAVVRFCYHTSHNRPNWTPLSLITISYSQIGAMRLTDYLPSHMNARSWTNRWLSILIMTSPKKDCAMCFQLWAFNIPIRANKISNMAEVAPRESIMSLVTEKSEQRRVLRSARISVEPVMEDSESCFSDSGSVWTVEDTTRGKKNAFWCSQLVKNAEKHVGRQSDQSNEQKPNLKRQTSSLEESLIEGEGSLKKMRITAKL